MSGDPFKWASPDQRRAIREIHLACKEEAHVDRSGPERAALREKKLRENARRIYHETGGRDGYLG